MSSTKWLPRAFVVMVTAFASTGFFAESAFAATATGVAKVSGTTIQFTAAAGATNSVTVTLSGRTVTIDDRVAIRPGAGCKAVTAGRPLLRAPTGRHHVQDCENMVSAPPAER